MPSHPKHTSLWLIPILSIILALSPDLSATDMAHIPAAIAKQLRVHKIAAEDVSLYVHNIAEPTPLLAVNEKVPRNPASTIKLLTTYAGLDLLGPGYVWKTKVYITGTLAGGRLEGDLFIKGYGDPEITPENLWRLLWGVRERGIQTIAGNVILDGTYFEPPQAARGDFDGNAVSAYNALPAGLSINFQTTRIHLARDEAGEAVRVFTDPPLANLEVLNNLKLVDAPCQRKYHKPAVTVVEDGNHATLKLSGTFANRCGEESYPRLILDPAGHTAGAFAALWRSMGGDLDGDIREGIVPEGARQVYTLDSPRLEDVIRDINKSSNNLMSRTLFLTLGAEREGAPASLPKARKAVKDWLRDRGLSFPELVIDNGAGLSRDTRISAESMGRLLGYAYASPTMSEFMSSLAIAGVDGTMRKRFKKGALAGRAHLKTGTLRGTTGIAGYLLDKEGRRWIVVSLISNPRLQAWRGKGVENALLQWVYEEAGDQAGGIDVRTDALDADWFLQAASTDP